MSAADATGRPATQLLHLVFGGELKSLDAVEFANISALDIVGIYPNYAEAYRAWKAAAQRSVDNAHMRYFIVHMHRLLDPDTARPQPRAWLRNAAISHSRKGLRTGSLSAGNLIGRRRTKCFAQQHLKAHRIWQRLRN